MIFCVSCFAGDRPKRFGFLVWKPASLENRSFGSKRSNSNGKVGIVNQLWEEKLFQMAVGDEAISTDRICCLRKVLGKTLLVSLPQTSPQKYLLPYQDQLSSQGTLYRVLLSPKSQDHFSFWPFGNFHTRPESASSRNPRRLPSAILLSESRKGRNANRD